MSFKGLLPSLKTEWFETLHRRRLTFFIWLQVGLTTLLMRNQIWHSTSDGVFWILYVTISACIVKIAADYRNKVTEVNVDLENALAQEVAMRTQSDALAVHLREASHAKDEFLAMASHELRTPMASIKGWAQMLRWPDINGEMRELGLKTIEESASAQGRLVEDLLDLSRITLGQIRLNLSPVDVCRTLKEVVDMFLPTVKAKHLTLSLAACQPVFVMGDSGRLHQMVWNLVSNAVKYTLEGNITVGSYVYNDWVLITVEDTGKGIEATEAAKVFDKYYKAEHDGPKHHHGGLGLGLSIVRYLADLHGGIVMAESEGLGKGSKFTLSLPIIQHDKT